MNVQQENGRRPPEKTGRAGHGRPRWGNGKYMNRSERQLRETTVIATTVTVVVLIFSVIAEMVGFSKTDPGATPKKFIDVIAHWPRYLGIGIAFFIGTFWWQASQNEPPYLICRKCKKQQKRAKCHLLYAQSVEANWKILKDSTNATQNCVKNKAKPQPGRWCGYRTAPTTLNRI